MIIRKNAVPPFTFGDLEILDYTAAEQGNASLAVIAVSAGAQHPPAYSTRSDKYYYVLSGRIRFTLESEEQELCAGDCCVIPTNQQFSYRNTGEENARLLLFHVPSFDLDAEVFAS